MNQQLFGNFKSIHCENYGDFCYKWKPSHAYLFVVSKDELDTKEGTGKSMKNALVWEKAPLRLK